MSKRDDVSARWLVSDTVWEELRLLLPTSVSHGAAHVGHPPASDREVMNGIFYVLKTGCQWRSLDATCICSGSTAHERFRQWARNGVFEAFWKLGLKRYDIKKGIQWRWQSLDTTLCRAPVAGSKKQGKIPPIEANKE